MIIFEDFEEIAQRNCMTTDCGAIYRLYNSYKKSLAGNPGKDAYEYIVEHLPTSDDILISDVLKNIPSAVINASLRIRTFVKHRKHPVSDSVMGLYIEKKAYQELKNFIDSAIPVYTYFLQICNCYKILPDKKLYNDVIKMLGKTVVKEVNHPCCLDNEYLLLPILQAQEMILSAICSICSINTEKAPLISIEAGSSTLSVSTQSLQRWIRNHYNDTFYAASNLVPKSLINNINTEWNNTVALNEQSFHLLFPDIDSVLLIPLIKCITTNESYSKDILLEPDSFPQQKTGEIRAENIADTISVVNHILDTVPFIPLLTLSQRTGIKIAKLSSFVEKGIMNVFNGTQITYSEWNKHIDDLKNLVSMEEIVQDIISANHTTFSITKYNDCSDLIDYCENNKWWNIYHISASKLIIESPYFDTVLKRKDKDVFSDRISLFLFLFKKSPFDKYEIILHVNKDKYPKTTKSLTSFFDKYIKYEELPNSAWKLVDSLFYILNRKGTEISELSRDEIEDIAKYFQANCDIASCDLFSKFIFDKEFFPARICFPKSKYKRNVSAYSIESFAIITYLCVSPDAWLKEDLIDKAIEKPLYAHLWLYVACHCYSALRNTDYARLPLPVLPIPPKDMLAVIRSARPNIQDAEDVLEKARLVTISFLMNIKSLSQVPNKVANVQDVAPIYFDIPQSCYDSFGIILSISVAHFLLNSKINKQTGFIRTNYDKLTELNFFGEKFIKACDNVAFSGLRANKSFLQAMEYEYRNQKSTSPYISYALASALRSHKGGYGKLSETTAIYLKDANFAGLTAEFVAKQMIERGACSWIIDRVFETVFGKKYYNFSVSGKTKIIKAANIDAYELVAIKDSIQDQQDQVISVMGDVLSSPLEAKQFLNKYLSGSAKGKTCTSDCALLASSRECIYKSRQNCFGCMFEIRSKLSAVQYSLEYRRLNKQRKRKNLSDKEKRKNEYLAHNCVLVIQEIFNYLSLTASKKEIELYINLCGVEEEREYVISECC